MRLRARWRLLELLGTVATGWPSGVQSEPPMTVAHFAGTWRLAVLELDRDAPFGRTHNRRSMRLSVDRDCIESRRYNIRRDGGIDSSWTETWMRIIPDASPAGVEARTHLHRCGA